MCMPKRKHDESSDILETWSAAGMTKDSTPPQLCVSRVHLLFREQLYQKHRT